MQKLAIIFQREKKREHIAWWSGGGQRTKTSRMLAMLNSCPTQLVFQNQIKLFIFWTKLNQTDCFFKEFWFHYNDELVESLSTRSSRPAGVPSQVPAKGLIVRILTAKRRHSVCDPIAFSRNIWNWEIDKIDKIGLIVRKISFHQIDVVPKPVQPVHTQTIGRWLSNETVGSRCAIAFNLCPSVRRPLRSSFGFSSLACPPNQTHPIWLGLHLLY